MTPINTANERLKNQYQTYLREAEGLSPSTIAQHLSSLLEFELSTGLADFTSFDEEQAGAFKKALRSPTYSKNSKALSSGSIRSRLLSVKKFFDWFITQQKAKVNFTRNTIAYLRPSRSEIAQSKTSVKAKTVPTPEQVRHLMATLPKETEADRRSRALVAFLALSACRVTALTQIKLKHVDMERRKLTLDAREIKTKNSKSFLVGFFPICLECEEELADWIAYLRREKLFGENDPLFPKMLSKSVAGQGFVQGGLSREHVRGSGFITRLVGDLFVSAGLPRTTPHRFRDMAVQWMSSAGLSVEEHKAFSQSLGHEDLSVTLSSYGTPTPDQQMDIIERTRQRLISVAGK